MLTWPCPEEDRSSQVGQREKLRTFDRVEGEEGKVYAAPWLPFWLKGMATVKRRGLDASTGRARHPTDLEACDFAPGTQDLS